MRIRAKHTLYNISKLSIEFAINEHTNHNTQILSREQGRVE